MLLRTFALLMVLLPSTQAVAQDQSPLNFGKVLGPEQVGLIVKTETEAFARNLTAMTGKEIQVAGDYLPAVVPQILEVQIRPVEVELATDFLRARYGRFIGSLAAYTSITESAKKVVLNKAQVDKYLSIAGKVGRCGEYPCRKGCGQGGCTMTCASCTESKTASIASEESCEFEAATTYSPYGEMAESTGLTDLRLPD